MKELSTGAIMAFQIATLEVKAAKLQYIEKEHLLVGFCSLEKALMSAENFELNAKRTIQTEHQAITNVLKTFEISTTQLRRHIRRKLGAGTYNRSENVIHRSEACKQIFARAEDLAASAEKISCLHLLVALLEDPGEIISFIFQEAGVAPAEVLQYIITGVSPQQKRPRAPASSAGKEPTQKPEEAETLLHAPASSAGKQPTQTSEQETPSSIPASSAMKEPTQKSTLNMLGSVSGQFILVKGFTHWASLKKDVLTSPQKGGILKGFRSSDRARQKWDVVMALHALADLHEGIAQGVKGYNVRRLCRILDVLRTRKETIFNFLELIDAPKQKVIVFRALLDLSDPVEHEYKKLIQRFLGIESDIDDQDTLGEVLSRPPKTLKGRERVMKALHDINSAVSEEIQAILGVRKNRLGALLEALDMAEMRAIAQGTGKEITLPLYIGLAFFAIAAKTKGNLTVGNFLRKYLCKEIPLLALLGVLNRNVFGGTYMHSNLSHPEILGFPMDFTGPKLAIQEVLKAFDETMTKSQVMFDKDRNIVLTGEVIEKIPGRILVDMYGNITIDSPVTIRTIGKLRHIFLTPKEGQYKVIRGKVRDAAQQKVVPGPDCNIVYGTEIFLPNMPEAKLLQNSILHAMTPKGVVYGSPEPTENEIRAANELIDRRKQAETKKSHLLEGERPKPLRYKHLILLYVTKCALEKFYGSYMKNPQEYINNLIRKPGTSKEFQVQVDQNIYQLLSLVLRISSQFTRDKSGGWTKFWELIATTIPEQLCKYTEIMAEFRNKTTFILPVLEIQGELGEVYWNIAELMIIKEGHRVPPIPRATAPTGKYKEILRDIQQDIQTDE
jgi:hypothetical protein